MVPGVNASLNCCGRRAVEVAGAADFG